MGQDCDIPQAKTGSGDCSLSGRCQMSPYFRDTVLFFLLLKKPFFTLHVHKPHNTYILSNVREWTGLLVSVCDT